MSMTTLKFLLFAAAFVTVAGVISPMIAGTVSDDDDVELARGDSGTLYVMNVPAGYTKTHFILNPSGATPVTQLDFYFYADHDVTKYYDSSENNFTLYWQIENPNTDYIENDNWENFNPSTTDIQETYFRLENVNKSWTEGGNYDVLISVTDRRASGTSGVFWTFPITCRTVIHGEGTDFFTWLLGGAGDIGGAIVGGAVSLFTGVVSAVAGEDFANMLSSFMSTLGQILTMDFTGIPIVIRLMLAMPIWFGIGYVVFIIVRSVIPTVGGGSSS